MGTIGCTYANCECDPCCCDPSPNCDATKGDDLKFFEDETCCYGPWDLYVRENDVWVLNHTVFCLTDVYAYFNGGPGTKYKSYIVVLAGKPITWDAIDDPDTPECWFDIDPYNISGSF
jgi:hypothetical protein